MIDIRDLELLRTLPERVKLTEDDLQLIKRIRRDALLARTRIKILEQNNRSLEGQRI
jgi:hypothetical protein